MITTFGEIMLRISPAEIGERIIQATNFEIRHGGSESNVAIALANLGLNTAFITSLPQNPHGEKVLRQLRLEGVNTDFIKRSGSRMGMYWTENGTGPRNSFVIYDRDHSAFSLASYEHFDWQKILQQTKWFHFSGISPAVSAGLAQLLQKVVSTIKCPYSVDLNYRNKLWNWIDKDPNKITEIMTALCCKATLLAGNESDIQNMFGYTATSNNEKEKYTLIARQCFDQFPELKYIAVSNRIAHSANHNDWSGYLFVKGDSRFCYRGLTYKLDNIQDRVGTGDSFSAGIIYGLHHLQEMNWQQIIDFAVTLGALNHSTKGDASNYSVEEVLKVMETKGSGRIVR